MIPTYPRRPIVATNQEVSSVNIVFFLTQGCLEGKIALKIGGELPKRNKKISTGLSMELQVDKIGDVLVVKPLDKRLDALIASEFKDKVLQTIDEEKVKKVVIDLSKVEFVDSSGLGAIVSILKHVVREGRLVLCSLQKAVDELMELTRLYRVFETAKDVKEALKVIAR